MGWFNVITSLPDVILLTCFRDITSGNVSTPILDSLLSWVPDGMAHTYAATLFATYY